MANLIDCPVDKALGTDDPNNVFTCNATQTCCTVSLKPACCSAMDPTEAIIMQVQLWVPLLLVIILLALFIWWCRTDEPCCDVEKPCLYRCGCRKDPKDEEDDDLQEVTAGDIRGSRESLKSNKSSTTLLHDAEVDPTELEAVAEDLEASPDDEPVVAPSEDTGDADEGDEEQVEQDGQDEQEGEGEDQPEGENDDEAEDNGEEEENKDADKDEDEV